MAVIAGMTNSFKQEILAGVHDLGSGDDTIKIALYTSSADITPSTTAYSTTEEVTSSGYDAGGKTIASQGIVLSGSTVYIDFLDTDATWTGVTFVTRGALIYNSTQSDKSIAVLDFGLEITVTAGTFTVKFPTPDADDAIIRIR